MAEIINEPNEVKQTMSDMGNTGGLSAADQQILREIARGIKSLNAKLSIIVLVIAVYFIISFVSAFFAIK